MATSMALGGAGGMNIVGLGTSSPMGSGMPMVNGNGSMGNLTPSHGGGSMKYCTSLGDGGASGGTSSIHSPVSTPSSTPNSTITINSVNTGSIGKCPGSNMSGGSMGNNDNSANIIANNNSSPGDIFGSKCKRKINFSNLGMPGRAHQPATVAKRNARERNRVKQVNNGFAALKQHIPPGVRSKKMSKVETLRCAVDYIRNLQGLLTIQGLHSSSPAGSSSSGSSNNGGDIILMDDDDDTDENEDQKPSLAQLQQAHHHHQQQQHQHQLQQQQQQMNGVNNQRDAFALSSSSSSSPTSSADFVAAHLPHHLAASLHHHHLGNNNNSSNQLRHMSLSHHIHHHATTTANSASAAVAAAAILVDRVTPNSNQLSPTSSDDPSSPSYASEASYVNNGNTTTSIKGNGMYDYENYEPVSPEDDEELLDAIAWWQQS